MATSAGRSLPGDPARWADELYLLNSVGGYHNCAPVVPSCPFKLIRLRRTFVSADLCRRAETQCEHAETVRVDTALLGQRGRGVLGADATAGLACSEALLADQREVAHLEGTFICPEGAACFTAVRQLRESGWLTESDKVVVLNTGTGLIYPETMR
jgi:hypothetical protein